MIEGIKIDVGANLKGLRIGMTESLSLLDQWQGDAGSKVGKLWELFSEGFADGPMDVVDQVSNAFGGVGHILDQLETPLTAFDANVGSSVKGLATFVEQGSKVTEMASEVGIGMAPLIALFPKLGLVAKTAWAAVTGPIGLTIAGIAAVGTILYKNMSLAIKLTTDLTNRFVDLYNKSGAVKIVAETIAVAWSTGYQNAKAFFEYVALGLKTMAAGSQIIKSGNFSLLDNVFDMAGAEGGRIGERYVQGITEVMANSKDRVANGLGHVTTEDITNTDFFKGLKTVGDSVSSLMDSIFGDGLPDTFDPIDMGLGKIEGKLEKILTPLEQLRAKISELDGLMKNQFLVGNVDGARETMSQLVELEDQLDLVQRSAELLSRQKIEAPEMIAPLQTAPQLDLALDIPAIAATRIQEIELQLKNNPQNLATIEALEKELKELRAEAEKMAPTMDSAATAMTRTLSKIEELWKRVGENMQMAIGDAIASGITNIFDGPDKERLADLNAEIEKNQELLSDKTATKEQREAATARIKILQDEAAAEKARGNVIVQTTATILDAAKKQIQAAIAAAIASAIKGEATKGLAGLITAGIAVAGFTALFNSKVPKLAGGGVLDKPTIVEVGEYAGASNNPEIVTPQKIMRETFLEVINEVNKSQQTNTTNAHLMTSMAEIRTINRENDIDPPADLMTSMAEIRTSGVSPIPNATRESAVSQSLPSAPAMSVVLSGELSTRIEAETLLALVKIAHNNELASTGRNPFIQ